MPEREDGSRSACSDAARGRDEAAPGLDDAAPGRGTSRHDRGSTTAETAMALPSLVVVLLVSIWVLLCVAAQLRCVDAAHMAARAAARGDGDAAVRAAAARVAPDGAVVTVSRGDGEVQVLVRAQVRPFAGVLAVLPGVPVEARAAAADEAAAGSASSARQP